MIVRRAELIERMTADWDKRFVMDPFVPSDDDDPGAASIDFHLGNRFLLARRGLGVGIANLGASDAEEDAASTKEMYVPNGQPFPIYPRQLVLAVSLEWFRVPRDMMASIVDRSAWGRHGLMISIARSIHPGGSGNVTLEIANLGETVMIVHPGKAIGQLQFTRVDELKKGEPHQHTGWCAMVRPELKPYRDSSWEKFLLADPRFTR